MTDVFICDAIRTPVGKYGGGLSAVRADDLAAIPIKTLLERNQQIEAVAFDDVLMGCANQAGEDNRNIARMALLLAGMPESVPGVTINRLCSSGMEAIGMAARAIKAGEAELIIAGGAESMSRSPFVMPKHTSAFSRQAEIYDSTIGWRFVNEKFQKKYGTDPLICTAENLAAEFSISREDQDRFAHNSQLKTAEAQQNGALAREIIPVSIPQRKGDPVIFEKDEHPRLTSLEKLVTLNPVYGPGTTVTAGNASGINDGAAAVIVASEAAVKRFNLTPKVRVLGTQAAGVPPRTMGIGPVPATNKLLKRLGMSLDQMDIIELNEAFAAQSLACTRSLGMDDDDPRLNPLGGAIALGHPLGMSGARLVTTAVYQLQNKTSKYALCTMCVGVGQGVSMVLEKV
ncbi:3-oxoadipyl-CoA thiolase [Draconibacterium orientale]|uniref:Beta-ketoadipyl-CoA thiolase n=1 Tax=Draconibacterium orientale TaxID=1168034 RepID=X5DWT3_9BACT|nr:3-oxoadipyl-CoA thiolase [Draconibacterium orientale]AHW58711.1 beta-ketoadipyl CoA thiolase [Draconibacterium orientale]SET09966.1 3-oxoadipyl-CoA thiolase [Draconibacterium orientale]